MHRKHITEFRQAQNKLVAMSGITPLTSVGRGQFTSSGIQQCPDVLDYYGLVD